MGIAKSVRRRYWRWQLTSWGWEKEYHDCKPRMKAEPRRRRHQGRIKPKPDWFTLHVYCECNECAINGMSRDPAKRRRVAQETHEGPKLDALCRIVQRKGWRITRNKRVLAPGHGVNKKKRRK